MVSIIYILDLVVITPFLLWSLTIEATQVSQLLFSKDVAKNENCGLAILPKTILKSVMTIDISSLR